MCRQLKSSVFRKHAVCPSAATLLDYVSDELTGLALRKVRLHLGQCDFCRAEAQLLSRHPPDRHFHDSAPIPLAVRLLAQFLPSRRRRAAHSSAFSEAA